MEEICKKIYFLLESKFPECLIEGFRIIIQKDYTYGYVYSYPDIKNDDTANALFSCSTIESCINLLFKEHDKKSNWNKVITKLNGLNQGCDIEYLFDTEVQNIIDESNKYLESMMWRSKFTHGTFFDDIYDKLIHKRGIQKEVAGCLSHFLRMIASNIDEQWKEVQGEINVSPLSINAFYLDLNNQKKDVILNDLWELRLENRDEYIKNMVEIARRHNLIWNHAIFFVTFDGAFSVTLNYKYLGQLQQVATAPTLVVKSGLK